MDGVLEGATLLCVCKLVCSLLCLPAVSACRSPMSFCCCCLLIFTDIAVTIFLVVLWISEPWLPPLVVSADVIALRFLLFLSHTYGAVLGFTMTLVAVEMVMRLYFPKRFSGLGLEGEEGEEEGGEISGQKDATCLGCVAVEVVKDQDQDQCLTYLPDFLCCLLVWVLSGLHGSLWSKTSEELLAEVCIQTTGSLPLCLPSLFTSLSGPREPCWGLVVLGLLIVFMVVQGLMLRVKQTTLVDQPTVPPQESCSADMQTFDQTPVQPPSSKAVDPGLLTLPSAAKFFVDSGKTQSRCCTPSLYARNPAQLFQCHHGNSAISLRLECLPSDGGQEAGNAGMPPPPVVEERTHLDTDGSSLHVAASRHGGQGGFFPSPRARLMTGLVCVFSLCVLPLSLSVNILLVYSVEVMLEWSIRPLLSALRGTDTPLTEVSHSS
ncbi:uncharacterized protein LOC124470925 isoform X2 [Hypomesus transpacificus]|nr:uncharacterized protein LOC124470925 isoform X2 [Hypomesus transpacificus]